MDYLRKDDTLVVFKLDRLGQMTKQLIDLVEVLSERGIQVYSINDHIDTSTVQEKFFFIVMAGFAQMEADLIRERTKAGLESARARGRKGGRPAMDKAKIEHAFDLYDTKKYSIKEITVKPGISKTKLYKELKSRG